MDAVSSYIIALSGGSGSGKSTLSEALLDRLGPDKAVAFYEDAYYWPLDHYGSYANEAERLGLIDTINFDDPASKDADLLAAHLKALKFGAQIDQPIYDFASHDRLDDTRLIKPAPIIVIEGLHVLTLPQIEPLINLSIYVDTPVDLRLARRIRRDVLDRGRDVDGVLKQYLSTVRPAHYRFTHPAKYLSDLVIADEGLPAYGQIRPSGEAIERMMAPVLARLNTAGLI